MPPKPVPAELAERRRRNVLALWLRWRLQALAQGQSGEDRAFAAFIGLAGAHWSRVKKDTPLGGKLARQIELACGVPNGWLDEAHPDDTPTAVTADPSMDWPGGHPVAGTAARALLQDALGPRAHLAMPLMAHNTPAGIPFGAADFEVDRLDLAQMLALDEPHCFMTRASGQSMTGRGIDHGDLIVVNRALQAQHHDIVVAVLDNEITLKTLHQRDGVVKLLPAHPDYPAIVPAEGQTLTVWGVVTACVKVYARKP